MSEQSCGVVRMGIHLNESDMAKVGAHLERVVECHRMHGESRAQLGLLEAQLRIDQSERLIGPIR